MWKTRWVGSHLFSEETVPNTGERQLAPNPLPRTLILFALLIDVPPGVVPLPMLDLEPSRRCCLMVIGYRMVLSGCAEPGSDIPLAPPNPPVPLIHQAHRLIYKQCFAQGIL